MYPDALMLNLERIGYASPRSTSSAPLLRLLCIIQSANGPKLHVGATVCASASADPGGMANVIWRQIAVAQLRTMALRVDQVCVMP